MTRSFDSYRWAQSRVRDSDLSGEDTPFRDILAGEIERAPQVRLANSQTALLETPEPPLATSLPLSTQAPGEPSGSFAPSDPPAFDDAGIKDAVGASYPPVPDPGTSRPRSVMDMIPRAGDISDSVFVSVAEAAAMLGVSGATIAKWVRDRGYPSLLIKSRGFGATRGKVVFTGATVRQMIRDNIVENRGVRLAF